MNYAFFVFPFFFYLGIAGQAVGLYLCGLLIPLIFLGRFLTTTFLATQDPLYEYKNRLQALKFLKIIGLSCVGLFLVFWVGNILNLWLPVGKTISDLEKPQLEISQLLRSRFSHSLLISGLTFAVFAFFSQKILKRNFENNSIKNSNVLPRFDFDSFVKGSFFASLPIFIYIVIQVLTGFDYREPNHLLDAQHHLTKTTYRAFGLYGHPLSMASVALALFSFWWGYFWMRLQNEWKAFKQSEDHRAGRDFDLTNKHFAILWLALVHLFFVGVSGGRTALLISGLYLLIVPMTIVLPKQLAKIRNFFVLGGLGLTVIGVFKFSVVGRLVALVKDVVEGQHFDRFTFWKVHFEIFKENPLFGAGSAWLDNYARTAYYNRLGYADLVDKFNAHNFYLETLATTGIFGFLAIAALLFLISLFVARLALNLRSNKKYLSVCLFYALLANLLHGLTQNTFYDAHVTIIQCSLLCVVISCFFGEASRNS